MYRQLPPRPVETPPGGRLQIGTMAGFISERAAGFILECMAGFVGIRTDDIVEETGESTRCTAGVRDPASKERFSEITSGSSRGQQGLRTTCQDSSNEAECRSRREANGSGT